MSVYKPPRPPPSYQEIRELAAKKMRTVFQTHFHVSLLLAFLQLFFSLSSPQRILLSFASFCNLVLLAQRFWNIQINSLIYWPPIHQLFFVISRILLVFIGIVATVLWANVGWCALVLVEENEEIFQWKWKLRTNTTALCVMYKCMIVSMKIECQQ